MRFIPNLPYSTFIIYFVYLDVLFKESKSYLEVTSEEKTS
uniref:Uncharacterized protein n=1 Tax=Anguilla anguilla TaxID=7936 RepID=A0A0E9QY70_ANGAN